jgi:glycosyltransferase involved in cell wall biosynthesis
MPSRKLEEIALHVWKLSPSRVLYIPNGIDCERFSVDGSSRMGTPRSLTIGTVATLRREKNIARLIEAFCAVSEEWAKGEVILQIVGDGPEREALQALAKRTSFASQIEFSGAVARPELFYRRMDVFALSSDTEQMPFSILEAMAAGLPIVSPAVGDIATVVSTDNLPQIVSLADEPQYRASMLALLRSKDLRLKIGLANQSKVRKNFDERLMAQRYRTVFG